MPVINSKDAQSTGKAVLYGFVSLVSVYGQKHYLWPNIRIFSYSVRLLPPPHCTFEIAEFYGKKRFLDESTDFFVLSSAITPSPDFRLAVLRARRVNLLGCAE